MRQDMLGDVRAGRRNLRVTLTPTLGIKSEAMSKSSFLDPGSKPRRRQLNRCGLKARGGIERRRVQGSPWNG
jgi:hypothetical protein